MFELYVDDWKTQITFISLKIISRLWAIHSKNPIIFLANKWRE